MLLRTVGGNFVAVVFGPIVIHIEVCIVADAVAINIGPFRWIIWERIRIVTHTIVIGISMVAWIIWK